VIIVAGFLVVHPNERERYLQDCIAVIEAARATDGCVDFHLSADPIEPGRINVFEQWESVQAVETFRGSGPSAGQQTAILGATVTQHEIATSSSLT
jgi:quinol monooxygenase YgiN